jgi:hypothetical protein
MKSTEVSSTNEITDCDEVESVLVAKVRNISKLLSQNRDWTSEENHKNPSG